VVVDIDVKPAGTGYAAFNQARAARITTGWAAVVRTPSGGAHVYYPATPGRVQSCWQTAARVDFRGDGGYVIAPPSVADTGGGYVLVSGADPAGVARLDADSLRAQVSPRPERRPMPRLPGPARDAGGADAERIAAWVARRGPGERNASLFWAANRLAEAGLTPTETLDALGPAAEHAGLDQREITATIGSAYRTTSSPTGHPAARQHGVTAYRSPSARKAGQPVIELGGRALA
jgi:hypothetical protein